MTVEGEGVSQVITILSTGYFDRQTGVAFKTTAFAQLLFPFFFPFLQLLYNSYWQPAHMAKA